MWYSLQIALSLLTLRGLHLALRLGIQDEKTCWFLLHAATNFVIAAVTLPAFSVAFHHLDWIGFLPPEAPDLGTWDAALIGSVHLYHLLAFDMDYDDWFHHLLFVPFNQAAMVLPERWGYARWGPCIRMQHFFVCGLPGGLDYVGLALRRLGLLDTERQKRLQCRLNLCLRCPGLLMTISILLLEALRTQQPALLCVLVLIDAALIGFNSLYYTARVIRSYARLKTRP